MGGDVADARDAFEELVFAVEFGFAFDDFGDGFTDGFEFFLLGFDEAIDGGGDGFFGLGVEFGFEPSAVLSEGVGVAAEFGNALLFRAFGLPWAEFGVFGLEEAGDEFGVCGVAFIAAEFLFSEGFDLLWVDEVEAENGEGVESLGDVISVVAGLLETGAELVERSMFFEPFEEGFDAFWIVGKRG